MSYRSGPKSRPIRSCVSCRTRRVKCDQARPSCSECIRTGQHCLYNNTRSQPSQEGSQQGDITPPENPVRQQDFGVLDISIGGRSKYLGPSFWALAARNESEFSSFLQNRVDGTVPEVHGFLPDLFYTSDVRRRRFLDEFLTKNTPRSLRQILKGLPPRNQCDELWLCYLYTVYPVLPILHLPTFYAQYESFWQSIEDIENDHAPSGVLGECPSFVALLLACLWCGSRKTTENDSMESSTSSADQSRLLLSLTLSTLGILNFPRDPTIYSLTAFLMMHIPLIKEESENSITFIGTAYRVALSLGLHRDPVHFQITGPEAEIRRRLWWHIYLIDTVAAGLSGLPPFCHNEHDTDMIATNMDLGFGADTSGSYPASSVSSYTQIASPGFDGRNIDCRLYCAVARFNIIKTIRKILERQLVPFGWSLQEIKRLESMIRQADREMQTHLAKLPLSADTGEVFGQVPEHLPLELTEEIQESSTRDWTMIPTGSNVAFLQWAAKLLPLVIERAYCVLYQPFQRYADGEMWQMVRNSAIPHFQRYLDQYLTISTDLSSDLFQWYYPGIFQPLQAITALLIDMTELPNSEEFAASRHLIDRVFSEPNKEEGVMAESHGHIKQRRLSSSGKEAWRMIRELRRKVWQNAGFDPFASWSMGPVFGDLYSGELEHTLESTPAEPFDETAFAHDFPMPDPSYNPFADLNILGEPNMDWET